MHTLFYVSFKRIVLKDLKRWMVECKAQNNDFKRHFNHLGQYSLLEPNGLCFCLFLAVVLLRHLRVGVISGFQTMMATSIDRGL